MPTFTSGAQAGLSEQEQMEICLRFILSQGGLATTSQLYKVIESEIQHRKGNNYYLSANGKAFIRALINDKAVREGYIYPYDPNRPGWWITEEGEKFALSKGGNGKRSPTARAYVNFKLAMEEIRVLLDNVSNASQARNVSLKAALLLAVAAWETYVEDIFRIYRDYLLSLKVSSPSDHPKLSKMFNRAANQWLEGHPKPPDLETWVGDGWKEKLREITDQQVERLNTPNCANLKKLFAWIGWDITQLWVSKSKEVCDKIDKIISRRGELAHNSGDLLSKSLQVKTNFVRKNIEFLERIVEEIESNIRKKIWEEIESTKIKWPP